MVQTCGLLGLTTCLLLMIRQFDPVTGRHGQPSGLPVCVSDCKGRQDGDYQSCTGCRVYVTCTNNRTIDNRPCPANLVWDDYKKRCERTSATCTTDPKLCTDQNGKQHVIGASVKSSNPCDECTCESGPEIRCYTRDCPPPPCDQPVTVKGQCCPVCQECTDERGQTYKIGEVVLTDRPCTERCNCAANGRIDCKLAAYKCPQPSCADGAKPIQLKGICCPVCPEKVCKLPKTTGPCKGYFKRFYYNPFSKTCEMFVYGGCEGNLNNFYTLEKCQGVCVHAEKDECKLPKVVGRCRASIRRFYFNSYLGRCETFYYGGCGGNENNFRTIAECKAKCAKDIQNCSKIACPAIFCPGSYKLTGDCCQRCPDCKAVSCVKPECNHGLYTPRENVVLYVVLFVRPESKQGHFSGKCCAVCREHPDCSLVDCADVSCPGSYKLPGECCERCPEKCWHKGKKYEVGERFKDDCNKCRCNKGGSVSCTKVACAGCVVDGLTYPSGSKFKRQCNTCGCSNGKITCTELSCDNYCLNGLKPPTGSKCGGIAGLRCPTNQVCEMPQFPKYGADILGHCCADTSSVCPYGGRPLANTHCKPGASICPNRYTCKEGDGRHGVCCPDCRTVRCAKVTCKNTEILPGQCCSVCRGCTNKAGEEFEIGASVPDKNPCNYCACAKDGQIRCAQRKCAYPKCARNFKAVTPPGKCCPTCVAKGCINKEGELFKIGAVVPDKNPCKLCTCTKDGQTRCVTKSCAYPKCAANFQAITLPGNCCPTCVARECVNKDGSGIRNGAGVPNKDPCTFCSCDKNGQIECASISCALPKCDWNNKLFTPSGKCCPICLPRVCLQPKNTGRHLPFVCNKKLTRYFFDSKSGECKRFTYRGCFGNGNNFRSLSICNQTCKALGFSALGK